MKRVYKTFSSFHGLLCMYSNLVLFLPGPLFFFVWLTSVSYHYFFKKKIFCHYSIHGSRWGSFIYPFVFYIVQYNTIVLSFVVVKRSKNLSWYYHHSKRMISDMMIEKNIKIVLLVYWRNLFHIVVIDNLCSKGLF